MKKSRRFFWIAIAILSVIVIAILIYLLTKKKAVSPPSPVPVHPKKHKDKLLKIIKDASKNIWDYRNSLMTVPTINVHTSVANPDWINQKTGAHGSQYVGVGVNIDCHDPNVKTFNGNAQMRIRGSASRGARLKSYTLKTDKMSLFPSFPKVKKYDVYSPVLDKSCMRDILIFVLSNQMGQYATPFQFCELYIDNKYYGLVIVLIPPQQNKETINISTKDGIFLTTNKVDSTDDTTLYGRLNYSPFFSSICNSESNKPCDSMLVKVVEYDDHEDGVKRLKTAINGISKIQDTLFDPATVQSADKHFNLDAMIVNFLLSEFSSNVDSYRFNCFFTYLPEFKFLQMGPIWDFDLGFANCEYGCSQSADVHTIWRYKSILSDYDGRFTDGYLLGLLPQGKGLSDRSEDACGIAPWVAKMNVNAVYLGKLREKWREYTKNILTTANVKKIIDRYVNIISTTDSTGTSPVQRLYNLAGWNTDLFNMELKKVIQWSDDRLGWLGEQNLLNPSLPRNQNCYGFVKTDVAYKNFEGVEDCAHDIDTTGYCICENGYVFASSGDGNCETACANSSMINTIPNKCTGSLKVLGRPLIVDFKNRDIKQPSFSTSYMKVDCKDLRSGDDPSPSNTKIDMNSEKPLGDTMILSYEKLGTLFFAKHLDAQILKDDNFLASAKKNIPRIVGTLVDQCQTLLNRKDKDLTSDDNDIIGKCRGNSDRDFSKWTGASGFRDVINVYAPLFIDNPDGFKTLEKLGGDLYHLGSIYSDTKGQPNEKANKIFHSVKATVNSMMTKNGKFSLDALIPKSKMTWNQYMCVGDTCTGMDDKKSLYKHKSSDQFWGKPPWDPKPDNTQTLYYNIRALIQNQLNQVFKGKHSLWDTTFSYGAIVDFDSNWENKLEQNHLNYHEVRKILRQVLERVLPNFSGAVPLGLFSYCVNKQNYTDKRYVSIDPNGQYFDFWKNPGLYALYPDETQNPFYNDSKIAYEKLNRTFPRGYIILISTLSLFGLYDAYFGKNGNQYPNDIDILHPDIATNVAASLLKRQGWLNDIITKDDVHKKYKDRIKDFNTYVNDHWVLLKQWVENNHMKEMMLFVQDNYISLM